MDFSKMQPITNAAGEVVSIGGSEVASILGISPWRDSGEYSVYARRLGLSEPLAQTEPMEWGTRKEAVILQAFAEKNNVVVYAVDKRNGDENGDYAWTHSSPDAICVSNETGCDEIVEIKTASQYSESDWAIGVPPYYLTQVRWYMWLRNMPVAHVAVLIGSCTYRQFKVYRDFEEEEQMIEAVGAWYHLRFIEGVAPVEPLQGNALEELAALALERGEYNADADTDALQAIENLARYYERAKAAEVDYEQHKDQFARVYGGYNKFKSKTGGYSWIRGKTKTVVDWEAVALMAGATDAQVQANTTEKPGAEYMRFTFKK